MMAKKRCISALLAVFAACCLLTMSLFFSSTISVSASNGSNGTITEGEWNGSQTTKNLIYVSDENGTESQKSLAEFGWQNVDQVYPYSRHYTHKEVDLKTSDYGWGIQAQNGDDDIGNSSWGNGVWYRIILSEADMVKADKGDLTVSASSLNYRQTAATHQVSLKLFFDNIAGEQIGSIEVEKSISDSAYALNITDETVPAKTASIRYYVSNRGSLSARPFIGGLICTLGDKTAPAAESSALVENPAITARGGAIAGDTVSYSVSFDEKVSVSSAGTAKISVAGTQVTASSHSLSTVSGISTITYTFTIPNVAQNGIISFAGVDNCTVVDEAGNSNTVSYSGSPQTIQYYKAMTVTNSISKLEFDGGGSANFGTDYTAVLIPSTGYILPQSITVRVGGSVLSSSAYTYSEQTGEVKIYGSYITGDIVINATGKAKESAITFDKQNGSGGTDLISAVYDSPMPDITSPLRTGYTFDGYYTQSGGKGTKYYNELGKGLINCDFDAPLKLYAHWIANTYRIEFDGNKPDNASGNVTGKTFAAERTYDDGEISLPSNDFALTGWSFQGWATSASGAVEYSDGQSVENLTADNGATVTLYAVWKANTYTVNYDANKPIGASDGIEGVTSFSSHTYDTASALTANGFTLKGWTFQGWTTSAGGEKVYDNNVSVSTLVAENGGSITLYAVWKANTYAVNYGSNKPSGASGSVEGAMDSSSHLYDTASPLRQNGFTITGWTFQGWALSNDKSKVIYTDGQDVSTLVAENGGQIALYAVWKANSHTLTLNAMGGSNSGSLGATFDSILPDIAAVPARYGYNFLGYFDSEKGGVQYYDADGKAYENKTLTVDDNIFLYAQWSPVTYTIKLYSEGKYIDTLDDIEFGELTLPSAEALSLTRKNFDFVGWNMYDEQNWAMYRADTLYLIGLTGEQSGVVVLYASWQEKPVYSLFYDANGGIGAPATIQVHEEETIILSETVPTRKDYTFLGWAASADSQTAQYYPGGEFPMGSAVVTLYAVWKHNPSFTYDTNGGRFIVSIEVSYPAAGKTVIITSLIPELEGHVFEGWSVDEDAVTATYHAGEEFFMPKIDTVLYAVWETAQYTVTS